MPSENETAELPPSPIPMDDTPVPPEVAKTVSELQAEGKTVNVKISQAEYAKLMQMPHEDRLEYALKVMKERERSASAKMAINRRLAEQRKRRRDTTKRKRQQRRKGRK